MRDSTILVSYNLDPLGHLNTSNCSKCGNGNIGCCIKYPPGEIISCDDDAGKAPNCQTAPKCINQYNNDKLPKCSSLPPVRKPTEVSCNTNKHKPKPKPKPVICNLSGECGEATAPIHQCTGKDGEAPKCWLPINESTIKYCQKYYNQI